MRFVTASLVTALALGSGYARAQEYVPQADTQAGVQPDQQVAQPATAAPSDQPPAPPQQPPAPPQDQAQAQPYPAQVQVQAVAPAQGQWVYTSQYGWVWMPYGAQYTYEPTYAGAYPSSYVYYPSYGWTWVTAPWIWGFGISPFFGVYGPSHFAWYGHVHYGHFGYGYGYGHPGYRGYGYGHPGYRGY